MDCGPDVVDFYTIQHRQMLRQITLVRSVTKNVLHWKCYLRTIVYLYINLYQRMDEDKDDSAGVVVEVVVSQQALESTPKMIKNDC